VIAAAVIAFPDRLPGSALPRLNKHLELRVALIAALALFFAQFGAMAHAYSHTSEKPPISSQQGNLGIHDFCNDCLNFAPLLSAAGAPSALPFALPQACSAAPQAQITCLVELKFLRAFRSRAPPVSP
jgi:hypothetical protein